MRSDDRFYFFLAAAVFTVSVVYTVVWQLIPALEVNLTSAPLHHVKNVVEAFLTSCNIGRTFECIPMRIAQLRELDIGRNMELFLAPQKESWCPLKLD